MTWWTDWRYTRAHCSRTAGSSTAVKKKKKKIHSMCSPFRASVPVPLGWETPFPDFNFLVSKQTSQAAGTNARAEMSFLESKYRTARVVSNVPLNNFDISSNSYVFQTRDFITDRLWLWTKKVHYHYKEGEISSSVYIHHMADHNCSFLTDLLSRYLSSPTR